MAEFRDYWRARTDQEREEAFECWWETHQKYRAAVFENAKPESKQYRAALRSKDEVRDLWMRRYPRPATNF